jgi:hypothetical protein
MVIHEGGPANGWVADTGDLPLFVRVVRGRSQAIYRWVDSGAMMAVGWECFAYYRVASPHFYKGWFYTAGYHYVPEQPPVEVMRDPVLWREWCRGFLRKAGHEKQS